MPQNITNYTVLISSPSDIRGYAHRVAEVLSEWSRTEGKRQGIAIEPLLWENNATPQMGDKAQGTINKELVSVCDMAVALFGTRLGTPVDGYPSGTVAEIQLVMQQGKPVSVFFSEEEVVPSKIEPEQLKRLQEYRQSLIELYGTFSNIIHLRKQIKQHIPEMVLRLHKEQTPATRTNDLRRTQCQSDILQHDFVDVEGRFPSKPKVAFEQLSKQELDFWMGAAVRELQEIGVPSIGPNATRTRAETLYKQNTKNYEELRSELLAAYRRDQRASESHLSQLAARRLPDDSDRRKKK